MKIIKYSCVLITTLFVYKAGFSINIEDAVKYALEKSETAIIAESDVRLLKESAKQAISSIKPSVSLNANYLDMGTNREVTEQNPYQDRDITLELKGSQPLFTGGKIVNSIKLKKNIDKEADILSRSTKRDIIKSVHISFNLVLLRKAFLEIEQDRLKQKENELKDAKGLKKVGMATILDFRQAVLMVNFAKNSLKEAESEYYKAVVNFNNTIGNINSENKDYFLADGKLQNIENIEKLVKKLKEEFKKSNLLDLKRAKIVSNKKSIDYKIARSSFFPNASLVGSYKSNGEKSSDMNKYWSAGLNLEWILMSGGLIKSQNAVAKIEVLKSKKEEIKIKKDIISTINKIEKDLILLSQRIDLQKEALSLSKQNYEDARNYYKEGLITLTNLEEFNLNYREARFNLQTLFYKQSEVVTTINALLYN